MALGNDGTRPSWLAIYGRVLIRYCDFAGRAGRLEYGLFYWGTYFLITLSSLAFMLGISVYYPGPGPEPLFLALFLQTLVLLPTLGVGARRCHDIGFSGYWTVLQFLPCVSFVFPLLLTMLPGELQSNRFGPPVA